MLLPMNGKLSSLAAPIYFVNHKDPNYPEGHIILAPYSDFPCGEGWSKHEADTLNAVTELQKRLTAQESRKVLRGFLNENKFMAAKHQEIRDRLRERMISSSTTPYEREFIQLFLQSREEKRADYERRYTCDTAAQVILHAHNYDTPKGREANQEKVSLDRIG